jgi:hypothetical protein
VASLEGDNFIRGMASLEGDNFIRGMASLEGDNFIRGMASHEGDNFIRGMASLEGDNFIRGMASFEGDNFIRGIRPLLKVTILLHFIFSVHLKSDLMRELAFGGSGLISRYRKCTFSLVDIFIGPLHIYRYSTDLGIS